MIALLRRLREDRRGATLVEFAILVPVILGTFLGVVQVGLGMQAYNALRNVSADTSRYATVEFQKENTLTTTDIETEAKAIATAMPYAMEGGRFVASVTKPATQRIDGAVEYQIETRYTVRSVLPFLGIADIPISFTRPIFVLDTSAP